MSFVWLIGGVPEQRPYLPPAPAARVDPIRAAGSAAAIDGEHPASSESVPQARKAYEEARDHPSQPRRPALLAGQIMTSPVVTLSEHHTLGEAREVMSRHGFRHLPILSREGRLAGMLSERDLLQAGANNADARPIGTIMSRKVLTATPLTEIREIARVMVYERIHCLPILDELRTLVGILAATDILKCVVNQAPLDLWI